LSTDNQTNPPVAPINVSGLRRIRDDMDKPLSMMLRVNFSCLRLAFAAYRSFEMADGFVSFDAKTGLVDHYMKRYGAVQIGNGQRMFIPGVAGRHLIDVYLM
jgi:hypothetical protein